MKKHLGLDIVFIGDNALTIRCAKSLLSRGHNIIGLFSSSSQVKAWAETNDIKLFKKLEDIRDYKFDYLFSVVYYKIIPPDILALSKCHAINYHDSLLPQYAGLNSTSWAILNNEKHHGISWHIMIEGIDSGDILEQEKIKINNDETAFSLNIKCFEMAANLFENLITKIERNCIKKKKQDLKHRTYYSLNKKPHGNGIVIWTNSAEVIESLWRATNFNNYPNRFCISKILIGNEIIIPSKITISGNLSKGSPGTITSITSDSISIATGSHDIMLAGAFNINKDYFSISELGAKYKIKVNDTLLIPNQELLSKIDSLSLELSKFESYWTTKLTNKFEDLDFPFLLKKENSCSINSNPLKLYSKFPELTIFGLLKKHKNIKDPVAIILAAITIYFSKLNNYGPFCLSFTSEALRNEILGLESLYSDKVPFDIAYSPDSNLNTILDFVSKSVETLKKNKTYLYDIAFRFSDIAHSSKNIPVLIDIVNTIDENHCKIENDCKIVIKITQDAKHLQLCFNPSYIDDSFEESIMSIPFIINNIVNTMCEGNRSLMDFSIMSNSELDEIARWNNNTKIFEKTSTLVTLFEKQVQKHPLKEAVIYKDVHLTYSQLNDKANQLAHYLANHGITVNSKVPIYVDKGIEMLVGILAIIKLGAAYVPIDNNYTVTRIKHILKDVNPKLILSKATIWDNTLKNKVVLLDKDWPLIERENHENFNIEITHNTPLYVIYTSGSTGIPKGVIQTHYNVTRLFDSVENYFNFSHEDTWVLFHSFSFDFSVWEIWGALIYGGTLIIPTYEVTRNTEAFFDLLAEHKISILNQTPSAFYMLQAYDSTNPIRLNSLKYIIFGGEQLDCSILKSWIKKYPLGLHKIVNMYGITETTVHVTLKEITTSDILSSSKSVGKPLPDLKVYILDSKQKILPIGVFGEIYIGGNGLAVEYLNNFELTKQKFPSNPFISKDDISKGFDARFYKTGDIGRWLANGEIEYLGRNDRQVQVRGFRIELKEVEFHLSSYPNVTKAIVFANDNNSLTACLITKNSVSLTPFEIKSFLKNKLPEYMIPSYFNFIDVIPLTSSGKIDYKKLLDVSNTAKRINHKYVAPRNDLEEKLCQVWQEILKVEKVSIDEDFFMLGGHSLLVVSLASKINSLLKSNISLDTFFKYPTIISFTNYLQSTSMPDYCSLPLLRKYNNKNCLSFSQERLYFLSKYSQNSNIAYNVPLVVQLEGPLDVISLNKSINDLIERHESLRTIFVEDSLGIPKQILSNKCEFQLTEINSFKKKDLKTIINTEFNLSIGPLFKMLLFKINKEKYIFLVLFHHILSDGWSINILRQELGELYNRYIGNKQNETCSNNICYTDFAYWQKEYISKKLFNNQLLYWENKLKDHNILKIPTDFKRPAIKSYKGRHYFLNLTITASQRIENLAKKTSSTTFMVLLTIFKLLLCKYTGNYDIVVGTPVANRNQEELKTIFGCFVNTLPLRTIFSDNLSFYEALEKVKQTCIEAYANQDIPFEHLVNALKINRVTNSLPILNVMFTVDRACDQTKYNFTNIKEKDFICDYGTSKFDLLIAINETVNGFRITLEYDSDLFLHDSIKRMAKHFENLSKNIIKNPKDNIKNFTCLEKAEYRTLLTKFCGPSCLLHSENDIPSAFEKQVVISPHKTALIFNEHKISYNILNEQANQLAHYLKKMGVKEGVKIAIYIDRSFELIISILGILKADATYVLLDNSLPKIRIEQILKEAAASFILTLDAIDLNEWKGVCGKRIFYNKIQPEVKTESKINLSRVIDENRIAYITFTSGSTGTPKGSNIPHKSVFGYMFIKDAILDKSQIFLQYSSVLWDVFTFELWTPILKGATCVLYPNEIPTIDKLKAYINRYNITIMWVTSSLFNVIIDEDYEVLKNVKQVFTGGEALDITHIKHALKLLPDTKFFNGYGPSECTVFSTCYPIPRKLSSNLDSVPIGKPIGDRVVYILDTQLNPVPIGVPGEIYITGSAVALGYTNNKLTKEKFIPNPFTLSKNKVMYKTGDLAKWLPDGNIEFLKRIDNQVKVRGFRVELDEIEKTIKQYNEIKDAVVIAREDEKKTKYLTCYFSLFKNVTEISQIKKKLYEYLKENLPIYMVPSSYTFLKILPLNSNNKIDKKALPYPKEDSFIRANDNPKFKNKTEKHLLRIWSNLLQMKKIGLNDNFFQIGGTSLLSIRLITELKKHFNQDLSLLDVFKYPTIKEFGNFIDKNISNTPVFCLQKHKKSVPLFLVHSGEGTIFPYIKLSTLIKDQAIYGISNPNFGKKTTFGSIEEMASCYIEKILKIQPSGPYILGGWSFGGIVAFEIARQLKDIRKDTSTLILIDSFNFYDKKMIGSATTESVKFLKKNGVLASSIEGKKFIQELKNNMELATRYNPKNYDGKINLLKASSPIKDSQYNGWDSVKNAQILINYIPCSHYDLFDNNNIVILKKEIVRILSKQEQNSLNIFIHDSH